MSLSISKQELEEIIEAELKLLPEDLIEFFNEIKTPLETCSVERWGKVEQVYIVAKYNDFVIYYDDIDDGYELALLNKQGMIEEDLKGNFDLSHVLYQLIHSVEAEII